MSEDPFAKFRQKIYSNNKHYETTEEDIDLVEQPRDLVPDFELHEPEEEEFNYVFFPKPDITTYELARIFAFSQFMITTDIYDKYPADLQKYFVKVEELERQGNIE